MASRLIAIVLAGAAAALPAAPPATDEAPVQGGPVFISPMGEPFRGMVGGVPPQARWFAGADLDHDGRITVDELRKDAARFFATLDKNHDGEIDPDELDVYENTTAPEIAALLSVSGSRSYASESDSSGDVTQKDADGYPVLRSSGSGHHRRLRREDLPTSYLGLTEPVSSADRNFNRGVSLAEFDAAAQQRFHVMDRANQGFLTPEGLKPLLR